MWNEFFGRYLIQSLLFRSLHTKYTFVFFVFCFGSMSPVTFTCSLALSLSLWQRSTGLLWVLAAAGCPLLHSHWSETSLIRRTKHTSATWTTTSTKRVNKMLLHQSATDISATQGKMWSDGKAVWLSEETPYSNVLYKNVYFTPYYNCRSFKALLKHPHIVAYRETASVVSAVNKNINPAGWLLNVRSKYAESDFLEPGSSTHWHR